MDEIDEAQDRSQRFLDQALNRHFGRTGTCTVNPPGSVRVPGNEGRTCTDCGDEIDAGRLEANPHATRCLDCQNKHERRERLGLV